MKWVFIVISAVTLLVLLSCTPASSTSPQPAPSAMTTPVVTTSIAPSATSSPYPTEQVNAGQQFVKEILDLLQGNSGWVPPLPPSGGEKPRILTQEEKETITEIASALPQVIEAKQYKDVIGVETRYLWVHWNGHSDGVGYYYGAEGSTANLSDKGDTWYPGVDFIFNSTFGKFGIAGIHVGVNLKTGNIVYTGGFNASDIIPPKPPYVP